MASGWSSSYRFCSLLLRPPTSTLFPYTTLFRSVRSERRERSRSAYWRCGSNGRTGERGDRKSTRLNSSHTVISYAVFCLKKKNMAPTLQRIHERGAAGRVVPLHSLAVDRDTQPS